MRGRFFAVLVIAAFVLSSFGNTADADYRVVRGPTGVIKYDQENTQPGYLIASANQRYVYLFDMEGYVVKTWAAEDVVGLQPIITREGHMQMGMGSQFDATIVEQDWDGNEIRRWLAPTAEMDGTPRVHAMHHKHSRIEDVGHPLYGHILQQSYRTYTQAEAIAAGRTRQTASTFRPDVILEFDESIPPKVVWEWDFFDNLGAGQYDKIDPNMPTSDTDFTHINSSTYDSTRNWVLFSSNNHYEFFAVNRDTKQIVYRFGCPANWDSTKQYATADAANLGRISLNDDWLFNNHDVRPTLPGTPDTTIMIFNNGNFPTGRGSIVYEVDPAQDKVVWRYPGNAASSQANNGANPTIFSTNQSGATRMPNGNTVLAMANDGHVVEVASNGTVVWEFKFPLSASGPRCFYDSLSDNFGWHCALKYPADHPGLVGKDLTTGRYRLIECPSDANPVWQQEEPAPPANPTVTLVGVKEWVPPADLLVQVQIDGPDTYDVYFDIQLPGSTDRFYVYDLNLCRTTPNSRVYFKAGVPAGTYNVFQFPFRSLGVDLTIPVRCQVYKAGYTSSSLRVDATGSAILKTY
jgi:hypothetical protein